MPKTTRAVKAVLFSAAVHDTVWIDKCPQANIKFTPVDDIKFGFAYRGNTNVDIESWRRQQQYQRGDLQRILEAVNNPDDVLYQNFTSSSDSEDEAAYRSQLRQYGYTY